MNFRLVSVNINFDEDVSFITNRR